MIKQVSGIPCPSCGSTRSLLSIINGNFIDSIMYNPIGIILGGILAITPIWLAKDIISNKSTLFNFYLKTEQLFTKRIITIPSIVIVTINWLWTIHKGL
jgi:hypothetical protein